MEDVLLEEAAEEAAGLQGQIAELERELAQARAKQSALDAILSATASSGSDKISMQGFLHKKTPATCVTRDYDTRWFVLAGPQLRYYEEKGVISVRRQDGVSAAPTEGDPTSFTLYAKGMQRKFELRAASVEDRNRWVAAILRRTDAPGLGDDGSLQGSQNAEKHLRELTASQEVDLRQLLGSWEQSEREQRSRSDDLSAQHRDADRRQEAAEEALQQAEREEKECTDATSSRETQLRGALRDDEAKQQASRRAAAAMLHRDASLLVILAWWDKWRRWCSIRQRARVAERVYEAANAAAETETRLRDAAARAEAAGGRLQSGRLAVVAAEEARARAEALCLESEFRGQLSLWGTSARSDAEVCVLIESAAAVDGEATELRRHLTSARGAAAEAQQEALVWGFAAKQAALFQKEARRRAAIAADALPAFVAAAAQSLRESAEQRPVGRILARMSSWHGGVPWRWIYLWVDPRARCVRYTTRDPRFGEIESLPFHAVRAARAEALGDVCDVSLLPAGAPQANTCGFGVLLADGAVCRFVAATEDERDEWLETFGACASAGDAMLPPAADADVDADPTLSRGWAAVPPRPVQIGGSRWASLRGGGNPAAAAATTMTPGSPRRSRRQVAEVPVWARDSVQAKSLTDYDVRVAPASPRSYVW
eukprot:TRINITY_DN14054_c0_g1_i3.p1 TRINITY_DN14054_c0_g1~~TRINITY_DN14054_c0_g1_i3.p1  ORF type:complete len:657 (+),score=234.38 TRINITY_DN14054_c0_g1_i3:56-2026(+)